MEGIADILGRIGFNWKIALANLVNFLAVFYLLNRYIFGALRKKIDDREKRIAEGVENAKKAEEELLRAHELREGIIREAEREAHGIVQAAHVQGKDIVSEAEARSREEAEEARKAARAELARMENETEKKLQARAVSAAIAAAEGILGEEVDKQKSERIARDALSLNR